MNKAGLGVGRDFFQGGGSRGFSQKFFQGGPKVVKFVFYPSKLKNNLFLPIISKSRGWARPPLPTPMKAWLQETTTVSKNTTISYSHGVLT